MALRGALELIAKAGGGTPASSVMAMKVTADAARRFLFARQFLAPARSLTGGTKGGPKAQISPTIWMTHTV